MLSVPIFPDDDFVQTFNKISPHLVFETKEHVARFIFEADERDDICDRILDLFEDELDPDQSGMLMELIDDTFNAFSKTLSKAYNKHTGGVANPSNAISKRAIKTIMPHLNSKMRVVCASFAECVFAVRDEENYVEPPRPNPI